MEKEQKQDAATKKAEKLRRTGLVNSSLLALQFSVIAMQSFATNATFAAIICSLASIGCFNDALNFFYANKEK